MKNNRGRRPKADMHIAQPMFLDHGGIPDDLVVSKDEVLQAIQLFSSETRKAMSREEQAAAIVTLRKLEQQAQSVMIAQAAQLPEEARGIWQEKLAADSSTANEPEVEQLVTPEDPSASPASHNTEGVPNNSEVDSR